MSSTPSMRAPVTVRKRTRIGLPMFGMEHAPADLFAPATAMLDRFNVHLELPTLFASEEAREGWLELVCEQAMRPALFTPNVHRGRGRAGRTLGLTVAPGWHMKGKADLRSGAPDNQGRIRATLVLDLSLNVTRWIEDQDTADPAEIESRVPEDVVRQSGRARRASTLDGSDNFLSNRARVGTPQSDLRVANADALLAVYIGAVEAFLADWLSLDLAGEPIGGVNLTLPTLRRAGYAEVYHELFTEDAPSVVEGLRAACLGATTDPTFRAFIGTRIGGGMLINAPYLSVPLTADVDVVIYAKATNVLRCEVRRRGDLREEAHHRNRRGATGEPLAATLVSLKHSMTIRLQDFFAGIQMHINYVTGGADLLDLLAALHEVSGNDPAKARALLAQLGNFGGISETEEDGIAPPAVIQRLIARGVLSRMRYRHGNAARTAPARYALRPSYADTLVPLVRKANGLPAVPPLPN